MNRKDQVLCIETTHTPQGDGNILNRIQNVCKKETALTPQGDGNGQDNEQGKNDRKQPTPRKGTETYRLVYRWMLTPETTHTPQGDGNRPRTAPYSFRRRNNPHPARGRKPRHVRMLLYGTRNNPHPARGRKLYVDAVIYEQGGMGNNPHPARGRKHATWSQKSAKVETTHTPQGDGKPFVFTLQKLLEKPFTSPAGDN